MYPPIFNRFPVIQAVKSKSRHFSTLFAHFGLPGYAPGTIAVNVTWIEREFNAGQTPCRMYPSIFNRFSVTQAVKSKDRNFSTFFAHFGLPCVRPCDYRGKYHMNRKRTQCLSNASQHISTIYLQPFLRYSKLLVENCDIFRPHLCLAAPQGWPCWNFAKILIHKTGINGLSSCGEESMTICSAVLIQYQRVTDGRTDRQTDVEPISITCFSIADARKNVLYWCIVT